MQTETLDTLEPEVVTPLAPTPVVDATLARLRSLTKPKEFTDTTPANTEPPKWILVEAEAMKNAIADACHAEREGEAGCLRAALMDFHRHFDRMLTILVERAKAGRSEPEPN